MKTGEEQILSMKKITFLLLPLVYISCLQSNKADVEKSDVDSTIAINEPDFSVELEENTYYKQILDPLDEIIEGHNSFDYVPISTQTIAWFKKCRTALVKVYDSNHAASQLSDSAKVDSLFMELVFHYDLNNEEELSKHIGIRNQRIIKTIHLYWTTEKTLVMLQRYDNFEKEQMAWERLQMVLEEFYITAKEIFYTGGSGASVLCLMAMNAIYKNRYDDLERMLQSNDSDVTDILTARRTFIHSVDSIEKEITEEFSKDEWKIFKDIPQLIDRMHKAKTPLIKALDDWIAERKLYKGCANSIMSPL